MRFAFFLKDNDAKAQEQRVKRHSEWSVAFYTYSHMRCEPACARERYVLRSTGS